MHALVKINQYREQKDGTDLVVSVPDLKLPDVFGQTLTILIMEHGMAGNAIKVIHLLMLELF